jgi:hypothetical protein
MGPSTGNRSHATDDCPTCKKARETQPPVTAQYATGTFFVATGTVMELPDGRRIYSPGLSTPGFSVARGVCTIRPDAGYTVDDVLLGPSFGTAVTGPGLSPEVAMSGNGAGTIMCVGANAGVEPGISFAGTYGIEGPNAQEIAAGNEAYRVSQNTAALQQSHDLVAAQRDQEARDAAALAEMDPANHK